MAEGALANWNQGMEDLRSGARTISPETQGIYDAAVGAAGPNFWQRKDLEIGAQRMTQLRKLQEQDRLLGGVGVSAGVGPRSPWSGATGASEAVSGKLPGLPGFGSPGLSPGQERAMELRQAEEAQNLAEFNALWGKRDVGDASFDLGAVAGEHEWGPKSSNPGDIHKYAAAKRKELDAKIAGLPYTPVGAWRGSPGEMTEKDFAKRDAYRERRQSELAERQAKVHVNQLARREDIAPWMAEIFLKEPGEMTDTDVAKFSLMTEMLPGRRRGQGSPWAGHVARKDAAAERGDRQRLGEATAINTAIQWRTQMLQNPDLDPDLAEQYRKDIPELERQARQLMRGEAVPWDKPAATESPGPDTYKQRTKKRDTLVEKSVFGKEVVGFETGKTSTRGKLMRQVKGEFSGTRMGESEWEEVKEYDRLSSDNPDYMNDRSLDARFMRKVVEEDMSLAEAKELYPTWIKQQDKEWRGERARGALGAGVGVF